MPETFVPRSRGSLVGYVFVLLNLYSNLGLRFKLLEMRKHDYPHTSLLFLQRMWQKLTLSW